MDNGLCVRPSSATMYSTHVCTRYVALSVHGPVYVSAPWHDHCPIMSRERGILTLKNNENRIRMLMFRNVM